MEMTRVEGYEETCTTLDTSSTWRCSQPRPRDGTCAVSPCTSGCIRLSIRNPLDVSESFDNVVVRGVPLHIPSSIGQLPRAPERVADMRRLHQATKAVRPKQEIHLTLTHTPCIKTAAQLASIAAANSVARAAILDKLSLRGRKD